MSTEKNEDMIRTRRYRDATEENEIEKTLNTVSYEDVKESKKEAELIGDSEKK
jgi:hypothetical protein